MLALNAITPIPRLPVATTQPQSRAPMAALELYARARDLVLKGQPTVAVDLLRQAIVLDPYRFDLRYELALAYAAVGGVDDSAITAFEAAAALDPDRLQLQTELGRLYLSKGAVDRALPHLRSALLTSEYPQDEGHAAVADFLLADALKQTGYDRAALDQYLVLLHRFENSTSSLRENSELAYLLDRPETLYILIGDLLEKHGEYDQAVKAFEPAAEREPDNFELQSRLARDLARLGRRDEALKKCVGLIVLDRATPASLAVLRECCGTLNIHNGDIAELVKLNRSRPADQAVLFALSHTLIANNRTTEAVQLLETAWQKSPGDFRLARELFSLYKQMDAAQWAAPLVIATLAHNPDALHDLMPLWTELFQSSWAHRLTLRSAAVLSVPASQQAAKQLLIALEAQDEDRPVVALTALRRAVDVRPIFPPTQREMVNFIWARPDLSDAQKIHVCDQLVSAAGLAKHPSLAEELRGRSLFAQKNLAPAATAFATAIAIGERSPELAIIDAEARRQKGPDARYEQDLWKLIGQYPLYQDAYMALFRYYAAPGVDAGTASVEQAAKVLATWLGNDPQCVTARVLQARLNAHLGQQREAEQQLLQLFADDPDDADVYLGLRLFYTEIGRSDKLIAKLVQAHADRPRDTAIVARIVKLYAEQKRNTDAVRLLDTTRNAIAGNADLLYSLTSLYNSLDQKQSAEELLQQIVGIDPTYPDACNDLGFQWADEGKNLPRAESLIRTAVEAEPDNQSFLDSLGWVLYKRGEFDAARKQLELAIGPVAAPDPAVLDHLGDTLYRLTKPDEARQNWQRSLAGLGDQENDRDDLRKLRLQLLQKIKAVEAKKPVDVAPLRE